MVDHSTGIYVPYSLQTAFSALACQASFRGETVLAWRNVGCFLGLVSLILTHLVFHFPCRYKIWHYTGKLLHEKTVGELWEVGLSKKRFF